MTAPAEDPRRGEACACGCDETDHGLTREVGCIHCRNCDEYVPRSTHVPAAGRGDTDSSGEVWTAYVATCQRCASAARPAVDRAEPPEGLRDIHTACDKRIRVERGEHGTKIHLTEPERGLGTSERTMWANLSPRDVHELVAALESATPRLADLLAAEAAVSRVRVLIDHPGLPDVTCRKLVRRALGGTT